MMHYFFDPVLFAPTVGCMLMCLTAACIGVFVVLRKESLLGEALSHSAYPGVIVALLMQKIFFPEEAGMIALFLVLAGAFFSCLAGMYCIGYLKRKRISQDAAMAFVLSSFFGLGIVLLSLLQSEYPTLYREMQAMLFGQAATMVQLHVFIYGILSLFTISVIVCFLRPIQIMIFDPTFATTIGISKKNIDSLFFFLIVFATVIGIRSVGVVLLSAMLIFPAATARFFVKSLPSLLCTAALIGIVSGFLGVFCSHELSSLFTLEQKKALSFPTGPMIVIWASLLFLAAALLSPQRGLMVRAFRKITFLLECRQENILKAVWKWCEKQHLQCITQSELAGIIQEGSILRNFLLWRLRRKGMIRRRADGTYELTCVGMLWSRKIVRLHRLWEVYLVEFCKLPKERVHPLAEEMEHILTEEMEEELLQLLHHPKKDPHNALIPLREGELS